MGRVHMAQLKLGIPKGSLERATIELFNQAGWSITTSSRNYFPTVNDPELTCALVRPQEMAIYVADGTLDLGLTGLDWIQERDCEPLVENIDTLDYSKNTNQPCRWVLVTPKESPIRCAADLQGKRIATELENVTRNYLKKHGLPYKRARRAQKSAGKLQAGFPLNLPTRTLFTTQPLPVELFRATCC